MPDCEKLAGCLFFNGQLAQMPVLSDRLRTQYCHGDFTVCARYVVCQARGRDAVPGDLFPNQLEKVAALLACAEGDHVPPMAEGQHNPQRHSPGLPSTSTNVVCLRARPYGAWLPLPFILLACGALFGFLLVRPVNHGLVGPVDNLGSVVLDLAAVALCLLGSTGRAGTTLPSESSSPASQGGRTERVCFRNTLNMSSFLVGLGILCWALGDAILAIYAQVLQQPAPAPSVADLAYLSGYPILLCGFLLLPRRPLSRVVRTRILLDGLMLLTAGVTFSWYFILGPTLLQGASNALALIVNVGYPCADLVLLCCLSLMLVRTHEPWQRTGGLILALGIGLTLTVDSVSEYQALQGTYASGGPLDAVWPMSYLIVGLGMWLLRRAAADAAEPSAQPEAHISLPVEVSAFWRSLWPYALVPAVYALLIYAWRSPADPFLQLGVYLGSAVLVVLVLARQVFALAENQEFARNLTRLHRDLLALYHNNTALTEANAQLEVLASTDTLTSLPNRGLLRVRLAEALPQVQRGSEPLGLLLLDLDRFKEVNDTLGHDVGDQLLVQVAQRLVSGVRGSDTVARLGGDEFAVLLPGAGVDGAAAVARNLRAAIEEPYVIDGQRLSIGASVGIAVAPEHGTTESSLLQHADVAMYLAKRGGLGLAFYDQAQDGHDASRLNLLADLQRAITADELVLHFQPEVAVASGEVVAVEALVRWPHPELGMLPPDRFIPLAEQTGLIVPLTEWVLNAALAQVATWAQEGLEVAVSVNLSLRNLRDPHLCETVASLLRRHAVAPDHLCLELTESVLMADVEGTRAVVDQLAGLGVRLAIDDFGTGYSSLAYLSQLPVHELKIDRSFVQHLASGSANQTIVASTIGLGHSLGMKVVTEGVETREAWALLSMMNADLGQGYFLARPAPAPEMAGWLRAVRAARAEGMSKEKSNGHRQAAVLR